MVGVVTTKWGGGRKAGNTECDVERAKTEWFPSSLASHKGDTSKEAACFGVLVMCVEPVRTTTPREPHEE